MASANKGLEEVPEGNLLEYLATSTPLLAM